MATTVTTADIGKVIARLPDLVKSTGHNEIYGIQLVPAVASRDTATSEAVVPPPVKLIIGKFLRAHKSDIEVTISGIKETLLWRKEFNPRKAAFEEEHDSKFNGIGYNTVFKDDNGKGNDIIVWNIYGALQGRANPTELFQPLEQFMRWRVGLMERCIDLLKLGEYTGDGTDDTKQAVQIHDYMHVKFFRMDPNQRATTKQVVDLMSKHYPESMSAKYMINVPLIMSWMMGIVKLLISRETLNKITVMSYGSSLVSYVGHQDTLPKEYGGKNDKSLKDIAEPWIPGNPTSLPPHEQVEASDINPKKTRDDPDSGVMGNEGLQVNDAEKGVLPRNEKPVEASVDVTTGAVPPAAESSTQEPGIVPAEKTT